MRAKLSRRRVGWRDVYRVGAIVCVVMGAAQVCGGANAAGIEWRKRAGTGWALWVAGDSRCDGD